MSVATKTIAREYAGVSVLREYIIDIGNLPDRMSEADYDALKEIEHVDDIKMLEYHFLILRILKLGILPEITPLWAFGNDFSSFQAVC